MLTQQLGPSSAMLEPPTQEELLAAQLVLIEKELSWHSYQPFTSLSTPLVFVHEPRNSGPFSYVDVEVPNEPNTGVHALVEHRQANAIFLSSERRLYELMAAINNIQLCHGEAESANPQIPASSSGLLNEVYNLLMEMQRQKEYHWAQQRGHMQGSDGVFVNTGDRSTFIP
jgi:hypothetical protein